MAITAIHYNNSHKEKWDEFIINNSRNGGIFHERKFLSYHSEEKFKDMSLVFFCDNGEIVAVLPAAESIKEGVRGVISHPGSTAGGIIYNKRAGLREVLEILESAIEFYKKNDIEWMELRIAEPIFSYPSHDELTYLLWHRGFKISTREISSCVDLSTPKSWEFMGRERNIRYIKSLSKKNISISQTEDLETVYNLVENNLAKKYNKKPTHTLDELKDLKKRYADRIQLWLAKEDGKPIASMILFEFNKLGIHDFYTAQDYAYSKEQVLPFLYYSVFDHYSKKGYKWFNIGISSRADWIKWGILEFKERTGARATFRENWVLNNVKDYKPHENDHSKK